MLKLKQDGNDENGVHKTKIAPGWFFFFFITLRTFIGWSTLVANNNVVDWYVDQFYEESNEAHDAESNSCSNSDFLELTTIRLCASFN